MFNIIWCVFFRAIGVREDALDNVKLDVELQACLDRNLQQIEDAEKEILSHEDEQNELQREIRQHFIDHQRKLENKNRHLTKIQNDLAQSSANNEELEEQVKGENEDQKHETAFVMLL